MVARSNRVRSIHIKKVITIAKSKPQPKKVSKKAKPVKKKIIKESVPKKSAKKPVKKDLKKDVKKAKQAVKAKPQKKPVQKKTVQKKAKVVFDVSSHVLVPKHVKVSDSEREKILETYNVTLEELPRISKSDAAISNLDVGTGDIIKVERPSATAKMSVFYRRVV